MLKIFNRKKKCKRCGHSEDKHLGKTDHCYQTIKYIKQDLPIKFYDKKGKEIEINAQKLCECVGFVS